MKRFFALGDAFMKESGWKDMALVKFCLCAMGIIIGILLPDAIGKRALILAGLVFLATYIPLMLKVYRIFRTMK